MLTNYQPAYERLSTLAHELGHGYHNLVRLVAHALQRDTPMTLAETASIFCETIVRHAAHARRRHAGADRHPGSFAAG